MVGDGDKKSLSKFTLKNGFPIEAAAFMDISVSFSGRSCKIFLFTHYAYVRFRAFPVLDGATPTPPGYSIDMNYHCMDINHLI
jgi:hypothetical protein